MRLQKFIHTKSLPLFADCAPVIRQGGLFEMLAQHVRQDGSLISVEWRAVAFQYQGRTCALALLRDVGKRVQAEQLLRQRVEARAQEQSTLLEISHTLASTLELQPGLILDQLRRSSNIPIAGLFALEDSALVALAMRGCQQLEQVRSLPHPLGWPGNPGRAVQRAPPHPHRRCVE